MKCAHQSQVQTPATNPSETAATAKTSSSKADTTPELSLPSFDEELPKDWQDLATYALGDEGDEEDPQTMTTKEHRRQVFAEITSDTGGADRPTVAQKVPRKIFYPQTPVDEEETKMIPQHPPTPTLAPPVR